MSATIDRPGSTEYDELIALVLAARDGDQQAWSGLVDRFARLVYAVCRGFRLPASDAADVSQTVWLRLAESLHRIEKPERIGAWLVTTTRRECMALLRSRARFEPLDIDYDSRPAPEPGPADLAVRQDEISTVASAFALLSDRCRDLLRRLVGDPEQTYQEISAGMGMPIGSIGPTRLRCLGKLRRNLEEAAYVH